MTKKLTIEQIDYHRNGVSGVGFHVILFRDNETPMLGIVFPSDNGFPRVACFDRSLIAKDVIRFGYNSFRGDHFTPELTAAIKQWEDSGYEKFAATRPADMEHGAVTLIRNKTKGLVSDEQIKAIVGVTDTTAKLK